jgi:hypothetical protein
MDCSQEHKIGRRQCLYRLRSWFVELFFDAVLSVVLLEKCCGGSLLWSGFPSKIISSGFQSEFWSKLFSTFKEIFSRNSDKQSKQKCWLISVKNALKFWHWYWNKVPKSELRCRNRNSNSEIEIRIVILENQNIEISTKLVYNFVGISISSKVNKRLSWKP